MRTRRRLLILTGGLFVCLWVFWRLIQSPADGEQRNLEAILHDLNAGRQPDANIAATELRRMGTNAVPQLLKMYGRREANGLRKFQNYVYQLLGMRSWISKPGTEKVQALRGFQALGPLAADAVPRLMEDLRVPTGRSRGAGPNWGLAEVLGAIGTPAINPLLAEIKTNTNPAVVRACIDALSRMGEHAEPALPALTNLVHGPDSILVIQALGNIGKRPLETVPLLAGFVMPANRTPNLMAVTAIGRFGKDAMLAKPELLAASEGYHRAFTIEVGRVLLVAGETNIAVNIASRVLECGQSGDRYTAALLLANLDTAFEAKLELLSRLASDDQSEVRTVACGLVEAISPTNHADEVSSVLITMLGKASKDEQNVVLGMIARRLHHVKDTEAIIRVVFALPSDRAKNHFLDEMVNARFINFAVVRAAMRDASPFIREEGVRCVRAMKDVPFHLVPDLVHALDDEVPEVRWLALVALQETEMTNLPYFDTWPRNASKEAQLIPLAKDWFRRRQASHQSENSTDQIQR